MTAIWWSLWRQTFEAENFSNLAHWQSLAWHGTSRNHWEAGFQRKPAIDPDASQPPMRDGQRRVYEQSSTDGTVAALRRNA